MSPKPSPWWTPDVHADRRPFLLARNRIQAALRGWFSARDFIEVDTATLQVSPGNEAHLHAFETVAIGHSGGEVEPRAAGAWLAHTLAAEAGGTIQLSDPTAEVLLIGVTLPQI